MEQEIVTFAQLSDENKAQAIDLILAKMNLKIRLQTWQGGGSREVELVPEDYAPMTRNRG